MKNSHADISPWPVVMELLKTASPLLECQKRVQKAGDQ